MARAIPFVTVIVLTACSTPGSVPPTPSIDSPAVSARPTVPSVSPTATATAIARSASDLLTCDGPVSESGGLASDFGPEGSGTTPEEAFESWLASTAFVVPRSGYERRGSIGERHVWTFDVEDRAKVVVVISPRFGPFAGDVPFTIEELRMCDVAELGPGVDLGPWYTAWSHVETGAVITDVVGPSHCGWESARLLHTTDADGALQWQYLRDPLGVLGFANALDSYAEGVDLPPDASFSGYRSGDGRELWFTTENRAAYVVRPDSVVERWPRAAEPIGCA